MTKHFFIVLLLCPFTTLAQEQDSTNTLRFGTYLSLYLAYPQALSELNQQLRDAQRLDLNDNIVGGTFGFTQRFADQNSYLVTRFGFYSLTDAEDSDDHTRLNVWEASVTGHYDLVPDQNWLVYPYLGLGFNLANLKLLTQTPTTFAASLATPNSGQLEQNFRTDLISFFDVGLGVERALRFPQTTVYFGASGGYRLSFSEPWNVDNLRYFTETDFSMQGLIVEFKLRTELTGPPNQRKQRGLFRFFQ